MNTLRKILKTPKVVVATGHCRETLWRKSRNPDDPFPAPVQLGPRSIGWYEDEIAAWLDSRPRVNYAPENKLSAQVSSERGE